MISVAQVTVAQAEESLDTLSKYFSGIRKIAQDDYAAAEIKFNNIKEEAHQHYQQAMGSIEKLETYLEQVNLSESVKKAQKTSSRGRFLIWTISILGSFILLIVGQKTVSRFTSWSTSLTESNAKLEKAMIELEESKDFSETVLNSIKDSISIIRPDDFTIVGANQVFLDKYNMSLQEVIGKKCHAITHGISTPCTPPNDPCPVIDALESNGYQSREHLHIVNGVKEYVDISVVPIRDYNGNITMFVHVARDITDQKNAEIAIIKAREVAERANISKSEFLANMSHELRTPMHGILSFSAMGIDKVETAKTERLLRYFTRINQSGERLLALLNDLLDISKLEAGRMQFEMSKGDIVEVLRTATDEFQMLMNDKNLNLAIKPVTVSAVAEFDPTKLLQVARNMLSNAIKFSSEGGTITAKIYELDMHGPPPALALAVSDNGCGVPEDELEAVFDKFIQSSKTKADSGGTGLGLAICKEIINAHRGDITMTNNPGGGATIEFWIPRKQPVMKKKKLLGEILVDKGHISKEDLEKVLAEQKQEKTA